MKKNQKKNWEKFAKYAGIGLLVALVLLVIIIPAFEIISIYAGNLLLKYVEHHPLGVTIVGAIIGFITYGMLHPKAEESEEKLSKPTMEDYNTALKTIRLAMREVASALELAPIESHTNIAADPDEGRIVSWERVWGMKYKVMKKKATQKIDEAHAARIIQAQVKTVLQRKNPSRYADIWFPYRGVSEPILQIADVKDEGGAYIYIYVVQASKTYFEQKANEEDNENFEPEADSADDDF